MSGICGIYDPGRELSARSIAPMLDALALAGETERATMNGHSIAFGVARRWNFQQVARVEAVSVVADADLVDQRPLADALSLEHTAAAAMPVAERIAKLYLARGIKAIELLRGGFSFAIWDERKQRLILAIDRLGIKSLYWRREGGRLLFSSRAGAIRAAQSGAPEVNPAAVLQFLLFASVPAPLTSDHGMEKLRPATFLQVEASRVTEHQYWDLEFPESNERNVSHWSRELQEAMRAAVHRNLEGHDQTSTGCYLSGGTDSSSVVAFASEVFRPAKSFSIAFEETGFSEIEYARTTASLFGTIHYEKFLTPQDASGAIDKIIAYYDEPFANSSAIGSYYCALLARENGVSTLLAGDGGHELFGGNERYAADKRFALYHSLPRWLRRGLIEPVIRLLPDNESKFGLPRRYVRRANIPNPRRFFSYGFFLSLPPVEVFEDRFLDLTGTENWLAIPENHFSRVKATSELNRILYLDLKMTLADNDLRKVSGTAELAGVNVRYPLLDDRLAELSGRIPASLKLKGFEKRYVFKQAMKGILPDRILYKKKHGFGVPVAQWLLQNPRMSELMRDLMHDSKTRQRGYFRPAFIARLMDLHKVQPNYYGEIVWYLVALELWHRQHIERIREEVHER